MMKYLLPVLVLALFASVKAMSKEEMKAAFVEIATGCRADNPVTDDEVGQLKQKQLPDSANARCLLNCVASTIGIIENGMLNEDAAHTLADKHIENAEELGAVKELINLCKGINDQPVSDGNKGCDRAGLLFKCMADNHSKFGLVL